MGLFDNEDEQDPIEARKRIPLDAEGKPDVRAYLAQKASEAPRAEMGPRVEDASLTAQYKRLANDDSAVKSARDEADSGNRKLDIIQGLATMFAGRDKVDSSFYNAKRQQNEGKIARAEGDKKQKLADLLTGDKVSKLERAQTVGSQSANAARGVLSKQYGLNPGDLSDFTYEEMLEVAKQMESHSKAGGKSGGFQQAKIDVPGKGTYLATFNPENGKYELSPHVAGYAQGVDATTGMTFSKGAPLVSGAAPIQAADGKTVAEVRTDLEEKRAEAGERGKQTAKDEHAVTVAESAGTKLEAMEKKYLDLYDKASKEKIGPFSGTGIVGGRASGVANTIGVSVGPATDQLITGLTRDLNAYISETTGAAMSEPEAKRLAKVMPHAGMDRALFASKLKEAREEANAIIADRRRVAGQSSAPSKEAAAPAESAKKNVVKKQYSPSANKTKLIYSDGSEEIVDGRQ
jgi:hypothetical protein